MRVAALVLVCGLIVGPDGSLPGVESAQRTRATGPLLSALRRRAAAEFLEELSPCFSLRENEDQRQLLCNDRRSNFNFNPFGLRFGKRLVFGRAVQRARTDKFSPRSLFSRELEVPT
ncbi:kisspeptin 2 [Pempheris klunzingeri]|uniref:kisspeptin 2 n=1 Tax=Pempheris klunzingeri TaxID=3127111 RepID=UPI00397EEF85